MRTERLVFCPWSETDWLALKPIATDSHWGRGLATEAARAALRDGFERAGLQRIVAVAHPANLASRHVMEKLGMQYERDAQHKGIDVVLYAIHAPKTPISSGT